MPDYYGILGVPKNASEAEIKKAFRRKAMETHPDRNHDPKAGERFKAINEAYEILGDPQKRWTYDQTFDSYSPNDRPDHEVTFEDIRRDVEDIVSSYKRRGLI